MSWVLQRIDQACEVLRDAIDIDRLAEFDEVMLYSVDGLAATGGPALQPGHEIGSSKQLVRGGEVLVSRLNPRRGHIALTEEHEVPAVCSGEFAVLRPREGDARFFAYFFQAAHIQDGLEAQVRSATKSHGRVDFSAITKLTAPLPSASEQHRMADFLDQETQRIDTAMAMNSQMVKLLAERVRASADAALSKAGGSVPLKRLLRVPPEYGLSEPADHDDPAWPRYVRITDIAGQTALRGDTFRSLPPDIARSAMLEDGDILLARSGATAGKAFQYQAAHGPACFAGYLIRIRPDLHKVMPEWLMLFLESGHYWDQIRQTAIQATISNVSAERYSSLRVPLPDKATQARLVEAYWKQKMRALSTAEALTQQNALLTERRRALITAAVAGQLDVGEAA